MNKYKVILECHITGTTREYDTDTGIMNAFRVLSDKNLRFVKKKVTKVVFEGTVSEPIKMLVFSLYDEQDQMFASAYIIQVIPKLNGYDNR